MPFYGRAMHQSTGSLRLQNKVKVCAIKPQIKSDVISMVDVKQALSEYNRKVLSVIKIGKCWNCYNQRFAGKHLQYTFVTLPGLASMY